MRKKEKDEADKIAVERIERLFLLAEKAAVEGDLKRADRYVEMAWAIKLKTRARLTPYQKRLFCRKCLKFIACEKRGEYRTRDGKLEVKCLGCGYTRRYPLLAKKAKV